MPEVDCCATIGICVILCAVRRWLYPPGPEIQFSYAQTTPRISKGKRHNSIDRRITFRVRCVDRTSSLSRDHSSVDNQVRLVVFDFDETLTMVTIMTKSCEYTPEQQARAVFVNFESPWSEGSRIAKLKKMLESIQFSDDGQRRPLAVLTKNPNPLGADGVLNLLKMAGLADYFSAIWSIPVSEKIDDRRGVFHDDAGKWQPFRPPFERVGSEKADVLQDCVENPAEWFPQLTVGSSIVPKELLDLKPESIVLVDDQKCSFVSEKSGVQVLRYCQVAQYDAKYHDVGFVKNMGGIGAHEDADFDDIQDFINAPRMYAEILHASCEEDFDCNGCRPKTRLVVFDFDETLTLATFTPNDPRFSTQVGWSPLCTDSPRAQSNVENLLDLNFETPYLKDGSRLTKLRRMLSALVGPMEARDGAAPRRALAVLSRHENGVLAVLNLLKMAGLAEYFAAIWNMPYQAERPTGAFLKAGTGEWQTFHAPLGQVCDHKADVLVHVTKHPEKWFPQLDGGCQGAEQLGSALHGLRLEEIVLVDDERANFHSNSASVLRYCLVPRYDGTYKNCGELSQLGGLGAHSDEDYRNLHAFVEGYFTPWEHCRSAPCSPRRASAAAAAQKKDFLISTAEPAHAESMQKALARMAADLGGKRDEDPKVKLTQDQPDELDRNQQLEREMAIALHDPPQPTRVDVASEIQVLASPPSQPGVLENRPRPPRLAKLSERNALGNDMRKPDVSENVLPAPLDGDTVNVGAPKGMSLKDYTDAQIVLSPRSLRHISAAAERGLDTSALWAKQKLKMRLRASSSSSDSSSTACTVSCIQSDVVSSG